MNGMLHRVSVSTVAISALVALAANATSGSWTGSIGPGSWKLDAPKGTRRWLVIRELPPTTDLSFHVEVLQSNVGGSCLEIHLACAAFGHY
jgi:hypothetical protein